MNFLGIGLPELIVVSIIAVIVVGPERLPGVAVQVARAIRQLRGYATDATSQLRAEFGELTKEYEEVRKELRELRQTVSKDVSSITHNVARALDESQPIIEPSGEPSPKERAPQEPTGS